MTLIDLGDLRDEAEPSAPSRRPRAVGRPVRVGLVFVVLLAVLAAAAPPAGRVHAVVPGTSGAQAFLTAHTLFVAEPPAGGGELIAYPLPDRTTGRPQRLEPRWRMRMPSPGPVWWVQSAPDGMVVVALEAGGGSGIETVVLDGATGRVRWQQPGFMAHDATGQALVQSVGGEGGSGLKGVDLSSGAVRWSRSESLPEGFQIHQSDGVIEAVVLVREKGPIEVLDPRTGAVVVAAELPRAASLGELRYQVVGDLLVGTGTGVVAAYGLDDLGLRWRTALSFTEGVAPCGDLICAMGQTGGVRALDPATGDVRWEAQDVVGIEPDSGRQVLAFGPDGAASTPRVLVLDVTSGREVADLGLWMPTNSHDDGGSLAVTRPLRGGGLLVATLDPRTASTRGVTPLREAAGDCQIVDATVVCRRRGGGFGLWQLAG
ncbi:outer membrane protein assembly factor BamB family protein [Micromonospora sp. BQ11]|uniref:outer membrane protein assembly factor BamB family protein n=1 Tax=Micromonospora sp. BQ11 TaxID=3452212 RepID=UPI003F895EB2